MQKPKQKSKIIELDGVKYRLSKLDARSASYLAIKAAALLAPAMAEKGDVNLDDVARDLTNIPRAEFDEMQTMLLSVCAKMNDVGGQLLPEPIIKADGSFVDEDMAYNVQVVMTLSVSALFFNVGDFFQDGGLLKKAVK